MKIIHRYWSGPPSPLEPWAGQTVRSMNPGELLVDWTDGSLPDNIRQRADDSAGQVRPEDRFRHRANLIRLMLLIEIGGRWVDHDLIPLRPFTDFPGNATAAHYGRRCNCYLSVEAPRNPYLHEALLVARSRPADRHGQSTAVSGESLLEDMLPEEFTRLALPFDALGNPIPGAEPWAIHLYHTAGPRLA